jgi:hypothetical protein
MATEAHEVLEWEAPSSPPKKSIFSKFATQSPSPSKEAPGEDATTVNRTFADRWLPHRSAGSSRTRRILFCSIGALILLILILGLGLGLGLSHKSWVNLNTFHPGNPI